MIVKASYVLELKDLESDTVMSWEFRNLSEVKQFLNKISNAGWTTESSDDATLKLYKKDLTWNLTTGLFLVVNTQITADF